MRYAAATDIGRMRKRNEDYFYTPDSQGSVHVIAVADGMGGYQGGDVASRMGIDVLCNVLKSKAVNDPSDFEALVYDAVDAANSAIWDYAQDSEFLSGMGTTLVLTAFIDEVAVVANVGDSRAYLWRANTLKQLTTDHSLVQEMVAQGRITKEEAAHHPNRNVITRALGSEESIEVDVMRLGLEDGDLILLCSDGLYMHVPDNRIGEVLSLDLDLETKCNTLIDAANKEGGSDNITVAIAHYDGKGGMA